MSGSRLPVCVLIVNHNGWRDTIDCLESLLQSDYPGLRICVLDNGSTDDSLAQLQRWGEPYGIARFTEDELEGVRDPNPFLALVELKHNGGFAAANNVGLRYRARVAPEGATLLLNNDAVVARDAISAMVHVLEKEPAAGAVGATILQFHQPDLIETLGGARLTLWNGSMRPISAGATRESARPSAPVLDYVSGCCMLVRSDVVERVGLMDERFFLYSEDADWGIRMTAAGLRLVYSQAAEVWHKGGGSVGHRSPVHDYYVVRAALLLVQKHFPERLPVALLYWLWRAILPKIVRLQWSRLAHAWRGYRDFLRFILRDAQADRA